MQVQVSNLTKRFEDAGRVVEVFKDLNFVIEAGEAVSIVGESGVGKTTLLYMLGTLDFPTSGKVIIGGTEVTASTMTSAARAAFRGKHIGFVFQFHQLLAEFTALENVAMPLLIHGLEKKLAYERAEELLSRVGLAERLTHRPGELSGGEQQRVALARALAPKPGLLLADEPTGNLDQNTGRKVQELLFEVQQESKVSLVIVTHNRELANATNKTLELRSEGIFSI